MKRSARKKNNGHASFWPRRDYVDGGYAETIGKKTRAKVAPHSIGLHPFAVFDCDGVFVSGHDDIEGAQRSSHRLGPGNIVINRDGVVLSVGVKNAVFVASNDHAGRPAGDSVLS